MGTNIKCLNLLSSSGDIYSIICGDVIFGCFLRAIIILQKFFVSSKLI